MANQIEIEKRVYTVKYTSKDLNPVQHTTEIVAESYEQAVETANKNYGGYKAIKVLKRTKGLYD